MAALPPRRRHGRRRSQSNTRSRNAAGPAGGCSRRCRGRAFSTSGETTHMLDTGRELAAGHELGGAFSIFFPRVEIHLATATGGGGPWLLEASSAREGRDCSGGGGGTERREPGTVVARGGEVTRFFT